jgi:phosphoglycerate dehydrogenase-like enzyme
LSDLRSASGDQRPLVIQTEHLDEACAAWLAERARVERCGSEEEPRFSRLLEQAEGLAIRTYTKVDAALLARAPRLRVVGRAGVGVDNVDLAACAARGITVVNTPAANVRAVVEYVTAVLFDAIRPRVFIDRALDVRDWKTLRSELIAPKQASELTLGIYGLGQIGSQVARVGAALNMRVIYHDLVEIPSERRHGAVPVSRDELLASADVLTIHVDGRRSNRGLIGAEALSRLKPDVVLINAARGFVIDAAAMAEFLRAHPAATAILDVHDPEPFGGDYPLLGLPNARLSPHIAAATAPAHRNMSWVVRDIWRVLSGEAPEFPARPEPD